MTAGGRRRGSFKTLPHSVAVLPLVLVFILIDAPGDLGPNRAGAQESPFGSFFGRVFGGRPRRSIDRPPPRYYIDPPVNVAPSQSSPAKKRRDAARKAGAGRTLAGAAGTAAAVETPTVAKAADAKVVLVVGDFLGLSLAKGLDASLANNAEVRVVDRTDGSSGIVRDDHFDWPARIGALIDEEKPVAVVVMLGANDRQAIRSDGASLALRSDEWITRYVRRLDALAGTVKDRKLPLVWVGLPAFKAQAMNDDVAAFNELYRQAAEKAQGHFVDVWDGFVDANGAFASTGPDVSGQPARLRNRDGITMTPQGARKLAFFAEKPLSKILGESFGQEKALPATASAAGPQPNPASVTSTPAIALNDPALDGGESLLGAGTPSAASSSPSPRDLVVVAGKPLQPVSGRADDFAWNRKTGPVGPFRPDDAAARGTLDLRIARDGIGESNGPPKPMPSLQDAILDDWAAQQKADATRTTGNAEPNTSSRVESLER